jgi:hypothetical protein
MMTNDTPTEATGKTRFAKTFLALLARGVPGILVSLAMAFSQSKAADNLDMIQPAQYHPAHPMLEVQT